MATENVENKPEACQLPVVKPEKKWVHQVLRVAAFLATASATIVMATNKETRTLVVATVGNTSIKATLTAKFQQTPAFVFFVIANGMASLHSLLMILVQMFGHSLNYKGLKLFMIAILDMAVLALVSGAANAAAFMADLGKKGNSHARWNKICDKFENFCDQGGFALAASFVGILLLLIVTVMSVIRLIKPVVNVPRCNSAV